MPPQDPPNPEAGPAALAHLVAELTAAVSTLASRVDLIERTLAPVIAKSQARAATPATPEPGAIAAAAPPPRPSAGHESNSLREADEAAGAKPRASFEDRLGSQVFNRIAIIAILIGATLFLKLAMDNHWIGPLGRVLIGLVAGAGLILWSERFRRKEFATFSYSLKAIGSGVLYLSLWASFQLYHLVPANAALALMLLITVWNAWMAWAQSSELLAAYAIAGAFATPLLLSTGGNHQVFLFSYLFTIDLATIVLVRLEQARHNNWSRLLLGALTPTIIYVIGWYISFYSPDQLASTSLFITLFFVAFLTIPFTFASPKPEASKRPNDYADVIASVLLPLANAVFASLAFYSVLEDSRHHAALPWVALAFAALYLAVMRLPQTVVARAVHLSLAVLFLTVTIPLKASGRWITIGWLAEGVALLWISGRLESKETGDEAKSAPSANHMLRSLSSLALSLGFFGLLFHAFWPFGAAHTAFFNVRFATELVGILALGLAAWISARAVTSESTSNSAVFPNWHQLAATSTVALNLVVLLAGVREIQTFWQPTSSYSAESSLQTALSISGFFMVYGAALLALGFWKRSPFLRWQALILLLIAVLKTFLYDVRSLSQGYRVASFLSLGVLLLGISFFYVRKSAPPTDANSK
jgi:uncharacterized membrane protein